MCSQFIWLFLFSFYDISTNSIISHCDDTESSMVNHEFIISPQENERLFRRTARQPPRCDFARRTYQKRRIRRKPPTVLIFQWTVFHRTESPRRRSAERRRTERKRNARFALSDCPSPSPPSRLHKPLRVGNPIAMCTELLLIKGIVEQLVEKPRREPRRRIRWNCIWRFELQREKGAGDAEGAPLSFFSQIATRPYSA